MGRHGLHAVHPRAWEKHHVLPIKGVRSPRHIARLVQWLSNERDPERRLRHLVHDIRKSPQQYTGAHVLQIAPFFSFNLIIVLHLMDHHLKGVTCQQSIEIMNLLQAPEQKLEALKVLSQHLLDPVNRNLILSGLPNSAILRQQSQDILDQARGASHVYGRITARSVIFLIDISGSMHTEFRTECGHRSSRLEYVVHDLHKILHHRVQPDLKFNIFTFNSEVRKWKYNQQYADVSTLRHAESFLDELHAHGGTNTHDALITAISEPDVEAIYLLSDGEPTSGITDVNSIISDVQTQVRRRATPVVIHTVAFLLGHEHNDPKPRQLMGAIAAVTGGVYRCLCHHAPDHEEHGDFLDDESSADVLNDVSFTNFYNSRMANVPQSALSMCAQAGLYAQLPPPPDFKGGYIRRPRSSLEVFVPKVEDRTHSTHHMYDVQVMLQGIVPKIIQWITAKTFNEFKTLHNRLVAASLDPGRVPFPKDHTFQRHNKAFLETRRKELEAWLQAMYIAVSPSQNQALNDFLMFDVNFDEAIAEAIDLFQAQQLALLQASAPPSAPPVVSAPFAMLAPSFNPQASGGMPVGMLPPQGAYPPSSGPWPQPNGLGASNGSVMTSSYGASPAMNPAYPQTNGAIAPGGYTSNGAMIAQLGASSGAIGMDGASYVTSTVSLTKTGAPGTYNNLYTN